MISRIAMITSRENPELWEDDQMVLPFLPSTIEIHAVPWDDTEVDWSDFDALILRGCWDYHRRLPEFLAWLAHCEQQGIAVFNPIPLVRWNLDKHYLAELEQKGVAIPPTQWLEPGQTCDLSALLKNQGWEKAVVKPAVSLGAWNTWVIQPESAAADTLRANALLQEGISLLVQPFLPEVQDEGEWSLLFFQGKFSHALLKRPAGGDFRVQHIHGGTLHQAEAPEWMISQAQGMVDALPLLPLYARVDGIRRNDQFLLMELELIEPVLYLSQGRGAAQAWANAIKDRMSHAGGEPI
ncbi:MAG: hypothetical protein IPL65_09775 [Lewinellaceae bacterium]|nr:hypothetical protein [Lewinellaceae bacterium]